MARTQIGLDIPTLSKPDKTAFDIHVKQLDAWIADLPRVNLGETAKRIYRVLKDTNKLQYSFQERVLFLERMREPVFYITSTMKKYYVGVRFPLSEKNLRIATASRSIFLAQAMGYKIALEEQLAKSWIIDKKLQARLLHRCLTSLGNVLLSCYQTYEPFPNNIWGEINKLFYYAQSHNLARQEIEDPHRLHSLHSTITEEYLRLLLTHLASPYRMKQGEIGKVYSILERWSKEARLQITAEETSSSRFAIDLLGNSPPRSLALTTEKHAGSSECRIIDTGDLAQLIQAELNNNSDMGASTLPGIEMQRTELSHDLLNRLRLAWGMVPKRQFPRVHKSEMLRITLGLSSTHKVIADGNPSRQSNPSEYQSPQKDRFIQTARFNSTSINDVNDSEPDVWNLIYPGSEPKPKQTEVDESEINDTQINLHIGKNYYHIENWSMLNESANGYCIASSTASDTNIQVGELVGIQRSGDGHAWKWGIGVVRWMKRTKQEGVSLGIEMLTPDAAAIGIKSAYADDESYKRTLMVPELPAIKQAKTLITGPVPYRVGNQLEMRILGKKMGISLTRQICNTGFFAQFEFDVIEPDKKASPEQTHKPDDQDDPDSLWTLI